MAGDDAKERLFKDLVVANQRRILPIARSYARADGKQATLLHYLEKQEPRPAEVDITATFIYPPIASAGGVR